MILAPLTREAANAYIALYHRHSEPVVSDMFRVALEDSAGGVAAIGVAGLPKARMLQDGHTFEITRVTSRGAFNACTRIYAALCDAGRALGWWRAFTYTLESEPGTSPKAAGFERDGLTEESDWRERGRRREPRLFEEPRMTPVGRKIRWVRYLTRRARAYYASRVGQHESRALGEGLR